MWDTTFGQDNSVAWLGFQDATWAYIGVPDAGLPTCGQSAPPAGMQCVHYRFDPASGSLHVEATGDIGPLHGPIDATVAGQVITTGDGQFTPHTIPPAGTTLAAQVSNYSSSGFCGTVSGCSGSETDLTLTKDGTFTLDGATATSGGLWGLTATWAGQGQSGVRGTYRIGPAGRLTLTVNGHDAHGTIGVVPASAQVDPGLVIGSMYLWTANGS